MNITYANFYKKENTKYFAVHNAGPVGKVKSSLFESANQVNAAHKQRWNFPSPYLPNSYGGYNFYLWLSWTEPAPDPKNIFVTNINNIWGIITQFRAVGEETCAQVGIDPTKGWRLNSFGIVISACISGDFELNAESPHPMHETLLRALYSALNLNLEPNNVGIPHRKLQPGTSCFGDSLPDTWARDVLIPKQPVEDPAYISALQTILSLLKQILFIQQLKRVGNKFLGVQLKSCNELDIRG